MKLRTKCRRGRSSTSSVKHHGETHIIINIVMKQRKGFNGDLKPEHTFRKHAYSNILKISAPKNEDFQTKKNLIFFIFLLKTKIVGTR